MRWKFDNNDTKNVKNVMINNVENRLEYFPYILQILFLTLRVEFALLDNYNYYFIIFVLNINSCLKRLEIVVVWSKANILRRRVSIFRRHLARNPFICDCNLRWLNAYLRDHPIETSGAKCESPKRAQKRKIDALRDNFKCKGKHDLDFSDISLLTVSLGYGLRDGNARGSSHL